MLEAVHLYNPPSFVCTDDIFKYETTAPFTVTYWPTWYLSLFDTFFPSSSHAISGVGFPWATHLRNTEGPGCNVSSVKASLITGGSTIFIRIYYWMNTLHNLIYFIVKTIVLHRPPNFNSALAWALSWSLRIKHWYMPLFSFLTDSIFKTGSEWWIGLPSFVQLMVLIGFPEKWHVKIAGLPKSTTCVWGSIFAERGAVTVKTVSTLSPPTELLTTHKYFPLSSTTASLIISVPDTCFTRSSKTTADFLVVPSMYLYHLLGNWEKNCFRTVIGICVDNRLYIFLGLNLIIW